LEYQFTQNRGSEEQLEEVDWVEEVTLPQDAWLFLPTRLAQELLFLVWQIPGNKPWNRVCATTPCFDDALMRSIRTSCTVDHFIVVCRIDPLLMTTACMVQAFICKINPPFSTTACIMLRRPRAASTTLPSPFPGRFIANPPFPGGFATLMASKVSSWDIPHQDYPNDARDAQNNSSGTPSCAGI